MGEWRPHGYEDWGLVYHYLDEENNIVCNPNPNMQKGLGYSQYDLFNKMIFKINNKLRLTSNIQYSTSSNIPRLAMLSDKGLNVIAEGGKAITKRRRYSSSIGQGGFFKEGMGMEIGKWWTYCSAIAPFGLFSGLGKRKIHNG